MIKGTTSSHLNIVYSVVQQLLGNSMFLKKNKIEFNFCSIFTIKSHVTFLNQYFIFRQ